MILISHRGNINGKIPEKENSQEYINQALEKGYNVEIDVWYIDDKWFLGHDKPQYEIELTYLFNNFLWCHAKNIQAFKAMLSRGVHCFWHQTDDVTLTSKGYMWTDPGKELTTKSICVLPEVSGQAPTDARHCAGICSDYVEKWKNRF